MLLGRQGRATFENLARYSRFTELTFQRQFNAFFDWMGFNIACVDFNLEGLVEINRLEPELPVLAPKGCLMKLKNTQTINLRNKVKKVYESCYSNF